MKNYSVIFRSRLLLWCALFSAIIAAMSSGSGYAATASWTAVDDPSLQGYRLYRAEGTCALHGYFEVVNNYGLVTSGPVTDPAMGGTYCHYLTAYNEGGESPISNVVEFAYFISRPPPQCPDVSYCKTLKGQARKQCLACR